MNYCYNQWGELNLLTEALQKRFDVCLFQKQQQKIIVEEIVQKIKWV